MLDEILYWQSVIKGDIVLREYEIRNTLTDVNQRIITWLLGQKQSKVHSDFLSDLKHLSDEIEILAELIETHLKPHRPRTLAVLLAELSLKVDAAGIHELITIK